MRKGHINSSATSFGTMDNLVYTYDSGNKLTKVLDNGSDYYGFKDGSNTDDDYTYDENGNMKTDKNKGITSIIYNHLNLPTEIKFNNSSTQKINYIYDATGVKLKKTVTGGSTTSYAGNYIYEKPNGSSEVLKFFSHPEGYVDVSGTIYDYVYQYKDHLGNIRLSYRNNSGSLQIVEENNYYPFGLKHKGYNSNITSTNIALKYKYQGQERQDELGLNWDNFKWRNHDPAIGRFMSIDPLTEDYCYQSPYNFSENRVIDGIELEGLEHLSHTIYSVNKDSKGNYNATYDRSVTQRDAGSWFGTKSQNTYNVYDRKGSVTAIYSGDNSLKNMSNAGIALSSVKNREVTAKEIINGARNNNEFKKAGETLKNVGSVATIVISGGTYSTASLLSKVVLGSGIVTSADDLTSEVRSNGQTVMENIFGEETSTKVKTVVGVANVASGSAGVLTSKNVVDKIVNATSTVLDFSSTIESFHKVKKNDDNL